MELAIVRFDSVNGEEGMNPWLVHLHYIGSPGFELEVRNSRFLGRLVRSCVLDGINRR
jgi:hypothetical protein